MEIRHTQKEDLNTVMSIYEQARQFMRDHGNPDQWGYTYPGLEIIKKDILYGNSYVCLENSRIVCVFAFMQAIDPTYAEIYNGAWLNDEPYGVVHRIASSGSKKGVASYCLNWCLEKCKNIRIDTYRDNVVMQNLLNRNGFFKCGIIYLEDGSERFAYQKVITE